MHRVSHRTVVVAYESVVSILPQRGGGAAAFVKFIRLCALSVAVIVFGA